MEILALTEEDVAFAVALWVEADLTRSWNDPTADFLRAVDGATSAVLGIKRDGDLIGTVMVGNDGHRGWVYYLAVVGSSRRAGIGTELMKVAEEWLRENGVVKVQLMVRSENQSVKHFYESIGYELNDVRVLSRRLEH